MPGVGVPVRRGVALFGNALDHLALAVHGVHGPAKHHRPTLARLVDAQHPPGFILGSRLRDRLCKLSIGPRGRALVAPFAPRDPFQHGRIAHPGHLRRATEREPQRHGVADRRLQGGRQFGLAAGAHHVPFLMASAHGAD